jgi:hypothetical protein
MAPSYPIIGLEEYIKQNMDPADYAEFRELVPGA